MALPAPHYFGQTYGALFIGLIIATFIQGILTVQLYYYYSNFPDDPRRTKVFVTLLWILDMSHLALIAYSVYFYLVLSWGDAGPLLGMMIIPLDCHLLLLALSTLLSQLFFLFRIWIFSERNLCIVLPVLLSILTTFGLILTTFGKIVQSIKFEAGVVPMFAAGAVSDFMIAGLLCYYILERSKGTREMKVTSTLVGQVIRYTVATSLLTSLLVLGCLITSLVAPRSWIFIAMHFSSGRTYTMAVLLNLNARRKYRETLGSIEPSFAKSIEFATASSIKPRLGFSRGPLERMSQTTTTKSGTPISKPELLPPLPSRAYSSRSRHSLP